MKKSTPEIINTILAQAVKNLRRRTGMTQTKFGALAGTGQNMQSRYEMATAIIPAAYLFEISIATNTTMLDIVSADIGWKVAMFRAFENGQHYIGDHHNVGD